MTHNQSVNTKSHYNLDSVKQKNLTHDKYFVVRTNLNDDDEVELFSTNLPSILYEYLSRNFPISCFEHVFHHYSFINLIDVGFEIISQSNYSIEVLKLNVED